MRNHLLGSLLLLAFAFPANAQYIPDAPPAVLDPPVGAIIEGSPLTADPCLGDVCPTKLWVDAGYLLWWMKKDPIGVPLLTTDPNNGATLTAGGLADPTTQVLLGNSAMGANLYSGGQIRVGYSLTDTLGIEAGGFVFAAGTQTASASSNANGGPFLFRPFVNVDTGNPNAGIVVAYPGAFSGSFVVTNSTQLWGTDALLSAVLVRNENFRLVGLAGFRYLDLNESLDMVQNTTDLLGLGSFNNVATAPGDHFLIQDSFHTRNQFYGGTLGLRGELALNRWSLAAKASVSLGNTHQVIDINGLTTLTPAAGTGPMSLPGGVLALPGNSGQHSFNGFSVVPEVGLKLYYQLTSHVRLGVGYDFLYWSNVVRPGSQINNVVSAAQLPTSPNYAPGATIPAFPHNTSDFWAQGLSFSINLRF